ncbi:hypothetical protein WJX73_005997 [Symbiochloris irregularis]|uniref:ABC transporter domain-containing protein n=1 Tax=Symbiochloris irregularis TaxID=706552 RepID=A0AAW1PIR7_9CHLO
MARSSCHNLLSGDGPSSAFFCGHSFERCRSPLHSCSRVHRLFVTVAAGKGAAKKRASKKTDSASGGSPKSTSSISSGIRLSNVAMGFKGQQVLKDVSWECKKGERVGLVGVNGAGKTTQLEIIIGKLQPDAGEVVRAKPQMRVAHLSQEFDVSPSHTVREEFMSAYGEQLEVMKRMEEVENQLQSVGEDMDKMQSLIDEMGDLQSKGIDLDVALIDKRIDQMMPELGFTAEDNDRLVASYSGGWQMRMCLGKILLQDPDILLLDEPTNHLDLSALEWLEGYLRSQTLPMVVVSHDREFLDQLCNKIVETEHGVARTYAGNYTQFVAAKEDQLTAQWVAYEKQQKEIHRQQEMVQRLSGGASSGRASTAEKELERLSGADGEKLIEKPFTPKQRSFNFPSAARLGQQVLDVTDLTHGYKETRLFNHATLKVEKGERIAFIGPNGCGKSTLLRLIMGQEQPISGSVTLGPHSVIPNYYQQNQSEALDPSMTVMETLVKAAPDAVVNDIKALLGRMLFPKAAMEKKVEVLSGGEKARLALAKFMLSQGTLLVLDEPTNHLDIPSKEMLEEAIINFEGSVLAVTHDRYFLRKIATRIVTVDQQQLKDYEGDYEEYLRKNRSEAAVMAKKAEDQKERDKSNIKSKSKMSKAEKARQKKMKAKSFAANREQGKVKKNSARWA